MSRRHDDNSGGLQTFNDEQLFHIFMDLDMPGVDMAAAAAGTTNSSDAPTAVGGGGGRGGGTGRPGVRDEMDSEDEGDEERGSEHGGGGARSMRGGSGRSTRARRRIGKSKDEVRARPFPENPSFTAPTRPVFITSHCISCAQAHPCASLCSQTLAGTLRLR